MTANRIKYKEKGRIERRRAGYTKWDGFEKPVISIRQVQEREAKINLQRKPEEPAAIRNRLDEPQELRTWTSDVWREVAGVFQFEQGDDLAKGFPGVSIFNRYRAREFDMEATGTDEKKQASSDKIMPLFQLLLTDACREPSYPLSAHITPSSTPLIPSKR